MSFKREESLKEKNFEGKIFKARYKTSKSSKILGYTILYRGPSYRLLGITNTIQKLDHLIKLHGLIK